ncbi:MAG: acyltransferase [Bdellovibrionia bacterium]
MKASKNIWSLDVLRAIAAFMVMAGHARNLFLVDYADLTDKSWFVTALYFFTGFLRESVIVFFVLSGFLVGGSIEKALASGKFRFQSYLTSRMVRLWVVLLPALALGLILDAWGIVLFETTGRYGANTGSNILIDYPDLYFSTLFGNALFVQTILVPTFGTNVALWSLANEFWYYLLYPIFRIGFLERTSKNQLLLLGGVAGLYFIGPFMASYGLIWCMGVVAWKYADQHREARLSLAIISAACFVGWLFASRTGLLPDIGPIYSDFGLGIATAVFIAHAANFRRLGAAPAKVWSTLSGFSYSLYLIHTPFLFFMIEGIAPDARRLPTSDNLLIYFMMVASCYSFAYIFGGFTEGKTEYVKSLLVKRFVKAQAAPAARKHKPHGKKAA